MGSWGIGRKRPMSWRTPINRIRNLFCANAERCRVKHTAFNAIVSLKPQVFKNLRERSRLRDFPVRGRFPSQRCVVEDGE